MSLSRATSGDTWTQADELEQIEHAGEYYEPGAVRDGFLAWRIQCLRGYLAALPMRERWFRDADPRGLEWRAQWLLGEALDAQREILEPKP